MLREKRMIERPKPITETSTLLLEIAGEESPTRIDKYLADQIPHLSRSRIQQLIEGGHVILNGKSAPRVSEKVKSGDRIQITLPPPEPSGVQPEDIPLDILYQDSHLLVLNKPPGLCVHPTESMKTGTLVNALLHHVTDLSGIGGILRPGIVHRLDRVTSGVILIAKNDEAHRALSADFKQRRIRKIYWALAHGRPPQNEGEVNLPIGRHPTDRKRMAPRPDGRPSLTRYRILREGLGGTLVELYPVTGRTHQIRVHLRHLGCPVIRDSLYALRKFQGKGALERLFEGYPGIALHAKSIRFQHPLTGQEMHFEAPLPEAFQSIVDQLR